MENKLLIALENTENNEFFCDIEKVHHLFVSGQSGSGKSIFLHKVIKTLITQYTSKDVKIVLIDPKQTEFCTYEGNPRIVGGKPLYRAEDVCEFLNGLIVEMNNRFKIISESGYINLNRYNENNIGNQLDRIVVIIDEYADLVYDTKKFCTKLMEELTSKGHGAGIHFIVSTQCPRHDIISSVIKANMIGRLSFKVADKVDSKFVLSKTGSENLAGCGEFLYSDLNTVEPVKGKVSYDEETYQFIAGKWKEYV